MRQVARVVLFWKFRVSFDVIVFGGCVSFEQPPYHSRTHNRTAHQKVDIPYCVFKFNVFSSILHCKTVPRLPGPGFVGHISERKLPKTESLA